MKKTMAEGCKQLVEMCADLKSHETALIISDPTTEDMGHALSLAAKAVSAHIQHVVIPTADMHGKEPPTDTAEQMKKADVIFGLTKMSMAHTHARLTANSLGARYLSLPDYSPELLQRPALFADFRRLTPLADHLAQLFTSGKKIKVTTTLGTALTLDITGRTGNSAPGWCYDKGTLASPPDAEANVPPLENATAGTWIVDGSIPCNELGKLSEPLILTIQQGMITAIEGRDAAILEAVFDKRNNPAVRIAAEFGIGLNPLAELIGSMLEDEGCLGTIHIGFGSNITIGGRNKVPFHLDTIVRDATVYIDEQLIMRDGELLVSVPQCEYMT